MPHEPEPYSIMPSLRKPVGTVEAGTEDISDVPKFQPRAAAVRIAQIKLRNDAGPTDRLGSRKLYLEINGVWYDVGWITSVPGIAPEQLVFEGATPDVGPPPWTMQVARDRPGKPRLRIPD